MEKRPVLVTTGRRGVFFGYADGDTSGGTVAICLARMAIRWGTTMGFLQLADTGPTDRTVIGSVVPRTELREVTTVSDVSAEAARVWDERSARDG